MNDLENDVRIISDTIQEFCGIRYYLCGFYYQNSHKEGERRLHRVVWSHYNGDIPDGYHVHHADHNPSNNNISNLECVLPADHLSHHGLYADREQKLASIEYARQFASEWHGSPEGIEWHRKQYELTKHALFKKEVITCSYCDTQVLSIARKTESGHRFCSKKCKAAWRRDNGLDDEPRDCKHCKQSFMCNKYQKKIYCSADCRKASRKP